MTGAMDSSNCNRRAAEDISLETVAFVGVPSLPFLFFAAYQAWRLRGAPRYHCDRLLLRIKLITQTTHLALQLAILFCFSSNYCMRGQISACAFAALSVLSAFACMGLAYLHHVRTCSTSSILVIYSSSTTVFDIFRVGAFTRAPEHIVISRLIILSAAVKALMSALEAWKRQRESGDEWTSLSKHHDTKGIRSLIRQLSVLRRLSLNRDIEIDDLPGLDGDLAAENVGVPYMDAWQRHRSVSARHVSLRALISATKPLLLQAAIPRAALVALNLCQPLLAEALISQLGTQSRGRSTGYGLAVAFAAVYTGVAVCNGWYKYFSIRMRTKMRACIITATTQKTAQVDTLLTDARQGSTTLITVDAARIPQGLSCIHDLWASAIQVALATYLLGVKLGVACILPLVIVSICTGASLKLSGPIQSTQQKWMKGVQDRISAVSPMLASLKSLKMQGHMKHVSEAIHVLRVRELESANIFRKLVIWTSAFSFIPEYMAPVASFLTFLIWNRGTDHDLEASRMFVSLSVLLIMTRPLSRMLQLIPELAASLGCLRRLDEYMALQNRKESRLWHDPASLAKVQRSATQNDWLSEKKQPIATTSTSPFLITIEHAFIGANKDRDVLRDINVSILRGKLTCLVGPVACGKSLFCKALLGDAYCSSGVVQIHNDPHPVAYCDQIAFLSSGSIRTNVVASAKFHAAWYQTVLEACALTKDLAGFPLGDLTPIGHEGSSLSGGQIQRVSLARAIYARHPILVLDDVLSALDHTTAQHVFESVLGPNGLARAHGSTVVWTTSSDRFVSLADRVIVLGVEGTVEWQGSGQELNINPEIYHLLGQTKESTHEPDDVELESKAKPVGKPPTANEDSSTLAYKEKGLIGYYIRSGGSRTSISMFILITISAGCYAASFLWLSSWAMNIEQRRPHNDLQYWTVYFASQLGSLASLLMLAAVILIRLATKAGLRLHQLLTSTICNGPWAWLSKLDAGNMVYRFSQDMQYIDAELPTGLLSLTITVTFALAQTMLIAVSLPWTVIVLAVVVVAFSMTLNTHLRVSTALRRLDLNAKQPLFTHYHELLKGHITLRAFARLSTHTTVASELLNRSQVPFYLLSMQQSLMMFVLELLGAIIATSVACLAVITRPDPSTIGIPLVQIMSFSSMLQGILLTWTQVEASLGAIDRIKAFVSEGPSEPTSTGRQASLGSWPQQGRIEFQEVTAGYGRAQNGDIIRGISLTVNAGEWVGICGRTGSGKSSLLLSLLGMLDVRRGFIAIDGLSLEHIAPDLVRQKLACIPQDPCFLPGSVRLSLDPDSAHPDEEVLRALSVVGLDRRFHSALTLEQELRADDFTLGERQVFAIAAAMLKGSKIVLIDEATSRIDAATAKIVRRAMRRAFSGSTVIEVAHQIEYFMDLDRVVVMDAGIVQAVGDPRTLIRRNDLSS